MFYNYITSTTTTSTIKLFISKERNIIFCNWINATNFAYTYLSFIITSRDSIDWYEDIFIVESKKKRKLGLVGKANSKIYQLVIYSRTFTRSNINDKLNPINKKLMRNVHESSNQDEIINNIILN
jgi:hypothetical protein